MTESRKLNLSEYDTAQVILLNEHLIPGALLLQQDGPADTSSVQEYLRSIGIHSTTKIFDGWNFRLFASPNTSHLETVEKLCKNIGWDTYTPEEAEVRRYLGDPKCCIEERKKDIVERRVRTSTRFCIQTMFDMANFADGLAALYESWNPGTGADTPVALGGVLYKGEKLTLTPGGLNFFKELYGDVQPSPVLEEGPVPLQEQIVTIGFGDRNYFPCKFYVYSESGKSKPFHQDRFEFGKQVRDLLVNNGIPIPKVFRPVSEILERFRDIHFRDRTADAREMEKLRKIAATLDIPHFDYTRSDVERNIFYYQRSEEILLKRLGN